MCYIVIMDIRDARTIEAAALYERRKQAVMLFQKGMKRHEIAPIVGVHRLTVGIWIKDWRKGGLAALKVNSSGRPVGSGRKLFPHEEREIKKALIDKCPDQLKLPFAFWTHIKRNIASDKTPSVRFFFFFSHFDFSYKDKYRS